MWANGVVSVNVLQKCTTIVNGRPRRAADVSYSKTLVSASNSGRIILEYEYFNEKSISVLVIVNNSIIFNQIVNLSEDYIDSRGFTCSETFLYEYHWYNIAYYGGATISNLSIHKGNDLPNINEYTARTWAALTTPYVRGINSNISHLSDNVFTSNLVDTHPNSTVSQLDSILVRGISQRISTVITTESTGANSLVTVWLPPNTAPNLMTAHHDFSIGDTISLDGCSQSVLNGTWKVESITIESVSFSVVGNVDSENGIFMVKRPPIGGGAWVKSYVGNSALYTSTSSAFGNGLLVDDTSKNATTLKIYNPQSTSQILYLKRNLKRASTHFQPDTRQSRPEWTIVGDDKRFYFAIAYKQNPTEHTQLIVFGDIKDWTSDEWKTVLVGYVDDTIGNVGSNEIFSYPEWSILDSGHLLCQTKITESFNGMVWVRSDVDGEYTYLRGAADCGQRIYPIPIPHTTY